MPKYRVAVQMQWITAVEVEAANGRAAMDSAKASVLAAGPIVSGVQTSAPRPQCTTSLKHVEQV